MEPQLPLVCAMVTLLPELTGSRRLSGRQYRPHIVLGPITQRHAVVASGNTLVEQYLGVIFWSGPEVLEPGESAAVWLALAYFSTGPEQYAGVVPGATFTVREGGQVVGYGEVRERDGQRT
jgi:hypothetical protein